jgi:hypothetical protein
MPEPNSTTIGILAGLGLDIAQGQAPRLRLGITF